MKLSDLRINEKRLWRSIETLSEITDKSKPWTRRSFSSLFMQGREWLTEEMNAAGLHVEIDPGGNLIGKLSGKKNDLPSLVTGSHSDTVPSGGRFDGVMGVLSGIEVARTLNESGLQLDHPLEVIDFLAEEPSEYGISCIGSRSWCGLLDESILNATDKNGETLAEGLVRIGGDPEHLKAPLRNRKDLAAFVELHIEQGPVLEDADLPIGVVTSIVGIRRWRFTIIGRPDHAGTTPMTLRLDALVGAAKLIDKINYKAHSSQKIGIYLVATVGRIDVEPNAVNAVPGKVDFVLELRSDSNDAADEYWNTLEADAHIVCEKYGLQLNIEKLTIGQPAYCDESIMQAIESAANRLKLQNQRMVSGAGHDAVYLSHLCPTGMIFIPCLHGRSHCPEEWATSKQVADGTDTLLQTLIELDQTVTSRKTIFY